MILEHLDISGYHRPLSSRNNDRIILHSGQWRRHIYYLARIDPLPALRRLHLAGLVVNASDLVALIPKHGSTLRHIELINLRLPGGS